MVNDELGDLPVPVSYCPLCGSGIVYERRVAGETLSFSNTSALYENDPVMVDCETGSYRWQVPGEASSPVPVRRMLWFAAVAAHPEVVVGP